jgi:hypothetical protein
MCCCRAVLLLRLARLRWYLPPAAALRLRLPRAYTYCQPACLPCSRCCAVDVAIITVYRCWPRRCMHHHGMLYAGCGVLFCVLVAAYILVLYRSFLCWRFHR